jgi:hypothetical protein
MGHLVARTSYSQADLDFLKQEKTRAASGDIVKPSPIGAVIVRFRGRGEVAYIQLGNRALLMEAFPGYGVLIRKSMRWWDDGSRVSESERDAIATVLFEVFRELGHENPVAK